MKSTFRYTALIATVGLTGSAFASSTLVYEGFNYETATSTSDRTGASLLHGQPDDVGNTDTDAIGLSGTWQDVEPANGGANSSTDLRMATGSLVFGDLPTSGNHVRADSNLNNDRMVRTIVPSLSGSGEIWFSFLANKLDNRGAAQGGIVIGNQAVNSSKVFEDTGSTGLNGIGIASPNGNNWTAYAWDGSTKATGGQNLSASGVQLLIGKLEIGAGSGGTNNFHFYEYQLSGSNTIAGGNLDLITSILDVDVDEAGLDTLNIARQVNTAYDEIRIGSDLDSVLGIESNGTVIPTPSAALAGIVGLGGLALRRRRKG